MKIQTVTILSLLGQEVELSVSVHPRAERSAVAEARL
jgi:hypothetical protein